MAFLVVREPGYVERSITLRDGFRIGRDPACDLRLADPAASRQHVELVYEDGAYVARDLGSKHGILVNDEPTKRRRLAEGDRIRVGSASLEYRESSTDAEPPLEAVYTTAVDALASDTGDSERLRLLYDVSRAVDAIAEPEDLLGNMCQAVLGVLGAERCVVGLLDAGGKPGRRIGRAREGASTDDLVVARAVLEPILERHEAVLMREARHQPLPHTLVDQKIRSAMGAPLTTPRRRFGFLYADDRGSADRFSSSDLAFLVALARLAAVALESAERFRELEAEAAALRPSVGRQEIVGESKPVTDLKGLLVKYGAAEVSVLVRGESGTGKELAAHMLHASSQRADRPFVPVNCAAIPDSLIESELFGYVKGAFSGATKDRRGRFALAHRGTLYLDEIGDLSLAAQAKVLRVLEDGEVHPLGSERVQPVDVRLVCATHKDLAAEIAAGRFREDLFYRIAVVEVTMPPLRDRGDDVIKLARLFLLRAGQRMGKRLEGLTPGATTALLRHAWPGNIRQLANEMEHAAILATGPLVDLSGLSAQLSASRPNPISPEKQPPPTLAARYGELERIERALCEEALSVARDNLSEAARLLGVTRVVLKRRVERFGLTKRD